VGSGWTLHDLRHTAAYRLARDPAVPITDVQWILGHQLLSTTGIYVTSTAEDVIESALAHHRRAGQPSSRPEPPTTRYRRESLDVMFGRERP
jgi:integrase